MLKENKKISIEVILYLLSIIILGVMTALAFNNSIWKDECCQLLLIKEPYSHFLFSSQDSAPPMHFIILKFLVDFAKVIFPHVSEIILAKLTSIIPFYIIFILSITVIRNKYGTFVSAVFPFLCITMPHMFGLTIEIRQYSWVFAIVTVWFLAFLELWKNRSWKYVIICTLLGVMATFTHYYACFAMVLTYIALFIRGFMSKDYKMLKISIFMMIGSCVLFLPWLMVVNLAEEVGAFHIALNIPEFLAYIFMTDTNKFGIGYIVAIIFWMIVVFFTINVFKDKQNNDRFPILVGLFIPTFVLLVGILFSLLIAPAFQPRYVLPVMGCFWLVFSIILERACKNKYVKLLLVSFLLIVAMLDGIKIVKDELQFAAEMEKVEALLEDVEASDLLVSNDYRMLTCLEVYIDNESVNLSKDSIHIQDIISNSIMNNNDIYYLELLDYGEENDFLEYCDKSNLSITDLGEYRLEYVVANVYRINIVN